MYIWNNIKDYPDYQVSNTGLVRSKKSGEWKLLRPSVKHKNSKKRIHREMKYVSLVNKDGRKRHAVHRLVVQAFRGDPPADKPEVDHINGEAGDNRVENLRWASNSQNQLNKRHKREDDPWIRLRGDNVVFTINYQKETYTTSFSKKLWGDDVALDIVRGLRNHYIAELGFIHPYEGVLRASAEGNPPA